MAARVAASGWKPAVSRRLTSFAALLICVLSLSVLAAELGKKPVEAKNQAGVLAEFKIEKGGRDLLLPLRIHEKECLFVVDTGATYSMFDVSLKRFLGEPVGTVEMKTAAEPVRVEQFNPPEAFVGNLDLREGGPIGCLDLELLRRVMGRDVRGISS